MAKAFDWTSTRNAAERKLVREYMDFAQHDPRLLTLLTDIMQAQPPRVQWHEWKERVATLAGWDREHDCKPLSTMHAYDVVYELCYSYCGAVR